MVFKGLQEVKNTFIIFNNVGPRFSFLLRSTIGMYAPGFSYLTGGGGDPVGGYKFIPARVSSLLDF